jgi:hypothetical protein
MLSIQEKDIIETLKVKKISVAVSGLILGVECNILVNLYDSDTSFLRQDILKLQGEDYQEWSDDDNYITNYVLSHYGFVVEEPSDELEEVIIDVTGLLAFQPDPVAELVDLSEQILPTPAV